MARSTVPLNSAWRRRTKTCAKNLGERSACRPRLWEVPQLLHSAKAAGSASLHREVRYTYGTTEVHVLCYTSRLCVKYIRSGACPNCQDRQRRLEVFQAVEREGRSRGALRSEIAVHNSTRVTLRRSISSYSVSRHRTPMPHDALQRSICS